MKKPTTKKPYKKPEIISLPMCECGHSDAHHTPECHHSFCACKKFKKAKPLVGKLGDMNDSTGKLPKITSIEQAFKEILNVANDKRTHFFYADLCDWLKLKMGIVKKFATAGLAIAEKESKKAPVKKIVRKIAKKVVKK